MNIPEKIKKKRKELKETQAEFGKRFGISHAIISNIERGKQKSLSFEMIEFLFYNNEISITTSEYSPICHLHIKRNTCDYGCCWMCLNCGMGRGQMPHNIGLSYTAK